MKKFIGFLAAALLAASCSQPLLNTDVEAAKAAVADRAVTSAAAPVAFFSLGGRSFYVYHGISGWEYTFNILVSNLAYDKKVNLHTQDQVGNWIDVPATFVASVNGTEELWQAKITGYTGWGYSDYALGKKFCINYTVGGKTYWDNNGGLDYVNNGAYLRAGINIHAPVAYSSYNNNVVVRNLGPVKKVNLIATFDDWKTTEVSACWFAGSVAGTDVELWSYSLPSKYIQNPDGTYKMIAPKYCFSYDVNGQTYWDANFGRNY